MRARLSISASKGPAAARYPPQDGHCACSRENGLDSTDPRLRILTERSLRPLVQITDLEIQQEEFVKMTGSAMKEMGTSNSIFDTVG